MRVRIGTREMARSREPRQSFGGWLQAQARRSKIGQRRVTGPPPDGGRQRPIDGNWWQPCCWHGHRGHEMIGVAHGQAVEVDARGRCGSEIECAGRGRQTARTRAATIAMRGRRPATAAVAAHLGRRAGEGRCAYAHEAQNDHCDGCQSTKHVPSPPLPTYVHRTARISQSGNTTSVSVFRNPAAATNCIVYEVSSCPDGGRLRRRRNSRAPAAGQGSAWWSFLPQSPNAGQSVISRTWRSSAMSSKASSASRCSRRARAIFSLGPLPCCETGGESTATRAALRSGC
jgi:hypothetical protein